ncbi:MAG: hypothetical protein NTU66_06095 [Elusimicrobia bacterium]|nr:hypothetical protein [Elusimicrobiota bacterium]
MTEQRQELVEMLQIMERIELSMAALYTACAERWQKGNSFWLNLVKDEKSHSHYFLRTAELIKQDATSFSPGRLFNKAAVETTVKGIEKNIEGVKNGATSFDALLYIARDYEHALMELDYREIIQSSNAEYIRLTEIVTSQTIMHLRSIEEKISLVNQSHNE